MTYSNTIEDPNMVHTASLKNQGSHLYIYIYIGVPLSGYPLPIKPSLSPGETPLLVNYPSTP